LKARIKYIASANGLSGTTLAKKFGIENSTTSYEDILSDPEVDAVLIATRHNQHASQVVKCLQAGKHVFVEKPLALNYEEIDMIAEAQATSGKSVMVGFNRRFSPFIQEAARFCTQAGAINVVATMNAGFIPANHWVHDLQVGGGRIIGEACHLVDLISFLTNSQVTEVVMNAMGENPSANTDNASILLRYANGSQGVINYFANGNKGYSKERIEIYWQQKTIVVDNFRRSQYFGLGGSGKSGTQDKGHHEQFSRWMHFLQNGGEPPVAFASILNTSRAVIAAVESLQKGGWQHVA
jgi:predicted dehydrogenase